MTSSCATCTRPVTDATICTTCAGKLEQALAEVEANVRELELTLSRQATRTDVMGGGAKSDPEEPHMLDRPDLGVHVQKLPYDGGASVTLGNLRATLVSWVRLVAEEREEPTLPKDTIPALAMFLLARMEWLRHHEAAGEAHDEITDAVSAAVRANDRYVERWFVGICGAGSCRENLYCREGAVDVVCPVCETVHNVANRREIMLDELDDQLATAEECSWAVSHSGRQVNPSTIRKWKERGRIFQHPTADGQMRYRVGDVLAILAADEQRQVRDAG